MAAAVIETIGVVSGGLGIVGFFKDLLPAVGAPEGTSVTVKVGIAPIGAEVDNLGGGISAIYGFNTFNEFIGQSDSKNLADGDSVTFTISQSSAGVQSTYVGIANDDDATCISWITVEQRDNAPGGAWTGDIGASCGQRSYAGNQAAGYLPDGTDYVPQCTWLDSDFTDGTVSAALKFRTAAYGEKVQDTITNSQQCGSTLFGTDDGPIAGAPAKRSADKARPQWIIDRLVMSKIPNQFASDLCNSTTSWGPDFIGTDGFFCDMGTKEMLPLCSSHDVEGCVEIDEAEKALTKRSIIARREVKSIHRSYKTISHYSL